VEHHIEHIFNKLGVTSRTAASVFALQNGLVT
jgi:DNA-binding NarL/FixJ family response regulator